MRPLYRIFRRGWSGTIILRGSVIPRGSVNPLPSGIRLELTGEIGSPFKSIGRLRLSPKNIFVRAIRVIRTKRGRAVELEEWIPLSAIIDRFIVEPISSKSSEARIAMRRADIHRVLTNMKRSFARN